MPASCLARLLPWFAACLLAVPGAAAEPCLTAALGATTAYAREMVGFNANYLFLPYDTASEVYPRYAGPLAPRVLRFPGGSDANAYHWEDGSYDEWFYTRIRRAVDRFGAERREAVLANRGILTLADWRPLQEHLGVVPTLVFNVLRQPSDSRAMALRCRELGIPLRYVELGNELYYQGYEKWTGSPAAFLPRLRAHAEAIRAVAPEAEIAVPVGGNHHGSANAMGTVESASDPRERANAQRAETWNGLLAEADFIQAVAVHHYLGYRVPPHLLEAWNRSPPADGDLYGALFFEAHDSPRWLSERFAGRFPGRRLRLTEWGVLYTVEPWFQTWGHALAAATFLLTLASQGAPWDMACYHTLTGRRFELFSPDTDPATGAWIPERMVARLPWYTLAMAGGALARHAWIAPLPIPDAPRQAAGAAFPGADAPQIAAWALGDAGAVAPATVLVISSAGRPLALRLPAWPGWDQASIRGQALSCPSLAASNGAAHRRQQGDAAPPAVPGATTIVLDATGTLTVPPYACLALRRGGD